MRVIDLGLISFCEAESIQTARVAEVAAGAEDTLYLLEHPPVVTFGRSGGAENLHADPAYLEQRGVEVASCSRGGNVTCHFPGQLVAYPVFRIERRSGGVKRFFADVEAAVIETLGRLGVSAHSREGYPGVWTDSGKIASIGIAVRRWVTYHGVAVNVGRDLSLFDAVTLCGIEGARPTSVHLERGDESATMQEVKDSLANAFQERFAHP